MNLFTPKGKDAPEGRPTERQTKLGFALRRMKFADDEFGDKAARARSYAQQLDLTVASLGLKGDAVKNTRAYRDAAAFYSRETGKVWEQ